MSEVIYSRPWGLYFLGTMLVSVPGAALVFALSDRFQALPHDVLFAAAMVLWISPAWAFVPFVYTLNSRVDEEILLTPAYSTRQRHGRLGVYDDFFVLREWDWFRVRTSIVRFVDVTRVSRPQWGLDAQALSIEFRTKEGLRVVRWPCIFSRTAADALEAGLSRAQRSVLPNDATTNPARRTAAS